MATFRLPAGVLSTGLSGLAILSLSTGLVLDTLTRGPARPEADRLFVTTAGRDALKAFFSYRGGGMEAMDRGSGGC